MRSRRLRAVLVSLLAVTVALGLAAARGDAETSTATSASGWTIIKYPQAQPACTGVGWRGSYYYDRLDCGFGWVSVSGTTATSKVTVELVGEDGGVFASLPTTWRSAEQAWQFSITPKPTWPSGEITARATVEGQQPAAGTGSFYLNQLGASVAAAPKTGGGDYRPGEPIAVSGSLYEVDTLAVEDRKTPVNGAYYLRVTTPAGDVRGPYGPFEAGQGGTGAISATLPAAATAGITATRDTNFETSVAVEVVNARYADQVTGQWTARRAGAGHVLLRVPPDSLLIENSFVSSVGWVKPEQEYTFRVFVRNFTSEAEAGAEVTIPTPDGTTFLRAEPTSGSGTATVSRDGLITWTIGDVPAASNGAPGLKTLVVQAKADSLGMDPRIVWKNLSSTATLTYAGGPAGLTSASHGPKVIPPSSTYDTARYGDRPFPVVPVDFFDRKHEASHTGDRLASVINSPAIPGSTFNLYQEMSYGQLFPHGTVPSAGVATKGWEYGPGFSFSKLQPQGTCKGTNWQDWKGSSLYAERVNGGWYQLPGDTEYYGGDRYGSALPGALAGIGLLMDIDSACGPTGKAVYDAAAISDPEIDYSDYDTDKDGVVDFFMMVYAGVGGHGASQTTVPPYDSIWPHSSSLEYYFTDPETGQKGYVSDDQLKDYQGRLLFYTDGSRSQMTTQRTDFPVYVRVGPYNVNPEDSIEHASVISHEYGHSLGLPDYYSLGSRETYGSWNLMASDHSQHMDVNAKQELGWVVPRVLKPGETTVTDWRDSKVNTHRIDWVTPDGTPYTLTGPNVDNGEAYVAKLPSRRVIDPAKVAAGASPDHVWWSQSGNDFGCAPNAGHNLDVYLPELAAVPAGTKVTVTFKSLWDIEWDYDYGFVMTSTDGGETYRSHPSAKGYTTATFNPNANGCQTQYGNGLTGTSASYEAGTQDVDRVLGEYGDSSFLLDEYDISSAAGNATVLRFSYATDPGLARPGWFIDDLTVKAGDTVIYSTDFEADHEDRLYNGGCKEAGRVAAQCTQGWQAVSASAGSPADHAYYLEMRDRSGFDLEGRGQSDRGPATFAPGLLLVYTDENHGYGNVGTGDPPAQTPVDSQPQAGNNTPNLDDAAFTGAAGDSRYGDSGEGWTDNYKDPSSADDVWRHTFDCLTFDVLTMAGDGIGPENPPYDLTGDVRFTLGAGCGAFDYGYGDAAGKNAAPTAIAQAKPVQARVGERVVFDGSRSFDDRQAQDELTYAWDFTSDGEVDSRRQNARHRYRSTGTFMATLRVTDTDGASDTDTVTIVVTE